MRLGVMLPLGDIGGEPNALRDFALAAEELGYTNLGLPDHVLGEAVQQRITTQQDAERWWVQTLAYHQGSRSTMPLRKAVGFLNSASMLTMRDRRLVPTELGGLTARLMVPPMVCDNLRQTLADTPVPATPSEAEATLAAALARVVPKLAQARVSDEARGAVAALLSSCGQRPTPGPQRGDLARAALLAVANSPEAFHPGVRQISGIPYPAMYQILEEAPRYLHWIACQGLFGTIHPWCAIVAADLERRITWRMLRPPRGSGRLLWACEQMATPAHAAHTVPKLWTAACARGYASPDWLASGRPADCELDDAAYREFMKDRATEVTIEVSDHEVRAKAPAGSVLATWSGASFQVTPIKRGYAAASRQSDAAVFTWRDDYLATGWLSDYSRITGVMPSR